MFENEFINCFLKFQTAKFKAPMK